MSLPRKLHAIARGMAALAQRPAWMMCRIDAPADNYTCVSDDGSLVTMIRVDGSMRLIGAEDLSHLVERLSIDLDTYFVMSGHTMQIVMEYDPESVVPEIRRKMAASWNTARQVGMEIDEVMEDWAETLAGHTAMERVFIVCWTHPVVLSPADLRVARKERQRSLAAQPRGIGAMRLGGEMEKIRDRHSAFVNSVIGGLNEKGIIVSRMETHDFIHEMRRMIDPDHTAEDWRPWLPGDPIPAQLPDGPRESGDYQDLLYPSIARQVFPRDAERIDPRIVRVGDRIYQPVMVTMPAKTPEPFNVFFRRMHSKRIPWRASFFIRGDGLAGRGLQNLLATLLIPASDHSKQVYNALKALKQLRVEGEAIVGFQAVFTTWARDGDFETLRSRTSNLVSSIQSWGSSDTSEVTGDPLLGVSSTVPAMSPSCVAPAAAAPLNEILHMMPLTRPASVWEDASILLRSPDGKLMPYMQGSSKQSSWISFGIAPLGQGKSVWLATQVFAFCMIPGLSRIPPVTTLDIGPSSKGPVDLLRALLPADQRHLAIYERIRMEPRYAVNVFDLPLGLDEPLPGHMSFLVNFCSLLATEIGQENARDGIVGIARAAIKRAYDDLKPGRNPRIYTRGISAQVDAAVDEIGMHYDDDTPWYEVRDALFEHGDIETAVIAQRYAVPLLADVGAAARHESIQALYPEDTVDGLPICTYFWRKMIESIEAYPILKEPTRFDLSNAKVIALDLDEVAPRGTPAADRQTAVMYMLARHVGASRFFVMPADVHLFPERYREYQAGRIEEIRRDPKIWNLDEVHRVTRNEAVAKQIVADLEIASRESRKWNLHIAMYSHDTKDIPEVITQQLATSVFLMGTGGPQMTKRLGEEFSLSSMAEFVLDRIRKPDERGAEMLALHNTASGRLVQHVVITLPKILVWAFSTTTEDVAVRTGLINKIDYMDALRVLSMAYPGGVKKIAEQRRASRMEEGGNTEDVEDELVNELLQAYYASRIGKRDEAD